MANKTIEKDYREIVKTYKSLIKINKNKLPKYFEDMFDDIEDDIEEYKKGHLLNANLYSLLNDIGKFINEHEIDISFVNESIINKIDNYCRIRSLRKACFSKPEDEYEEDSEINEEDSEEENKTNEISDKDLINELRIVLKKAIKDNDRELMICTMNYLNTLESNKKIM